MLARSFPSALLWQQLVCGLADFVLEGRRWYLLKRKEMRSVLSLLWVCTNDHRLCWMNVLGLLPACR